MLIGRVQKFILKLLLERGKVEGAYLGDIFLHDEPETVGNGAAPEELLGGDVPLLVEEMVEGNLLVQVDKEGHREEEGIEQQPDELDVAAIAPGKEGLLFEPGNHGLSGFALLVEHVVSRIGVGLVFLQVKVPIVEIYPLLNKLLHRHSAFDVGVAIGQQMAHISHRYVQEPQNYVKTFNIYAYCVVYPNCHHNRCDCEYGPHV